MERHYFRNLSDDSDINPYLNTNTLIPELSQLSHDELVEIFEDIIVRNNWGLQDLIVAYPKFESEFFPEIHIIYKYRNRMIEEEYPSCCYITGYDGYDYCPICHNNDLDEDDW